MSVYHILNGDALKEQFPHNIAGTLFVFRECLVQGGVVGNDLQSLIETRIQAMGEMFGVTREEYQEKSANELTAISEINNSEVNLWFEKDLFCQVNLWCVCNLLKDNECTINLILPTTEVRWGFGGMNQEELTEAFTQRVALNQDNVEGLSSLWRGYQNNDLDLLKSLGEILQFPSEAIEAHIARFPLGNGLPEKTLKSIMSQFGNDEFSKIFKAFSDELPIYGFGDMQVKWMMNQLNLS